MSEKRSTHSRGDVLVMSEISKTFPGVRALSGVSLNLRRGEVHALMGENGAGKSTLLKVLSGLYQPDGGSIVLDGKSAVFRSPRQAQDAGISTVYQELDLVPQLPTYENVYIGREPRRLGAIQHGQMIRRARWRFSEMGIDIDVRRRLGDQSPAVQQLTSIARALEMNAKVVVLDEATSSLDADETRLLFRIVRKLRQDGMAVLFVSHRLSEIYEICDRITLLREGELVGTYEASELTQLDLITKMVGHAIDPGTRHAAPAAGGDVVLRAQGLVTEKLRGVSVELTRGAVTGLAGLLGSGRTELARALFGADGIVDGTLDVHGLPRKRSWNIRRAIREGVVYTPEERRSEGIFPSMSVRDNITIASLGRSTKGGVIDRRRQREIAAEYVERLKIKTPSLDHPISKLSGGNQQKVILARWLATAPDILLLDEPTRGIDVGAKAEVEKLVRELADDGLAVLFISSELPELLRNSAELVVLRDGENVERFGTRSTDQDIVMAAIAGDGPQPTGESEVRQ